MRFNLRDYNLLQIHQKAALVCAHSILLDIDLDGEVICTLYAYSNYYIEVMVDNVTKQLINIVAFQDGERLDKYLDKIELQIV